MEKIGKFKSIGLNQIFIFGIKKLRVNIRRDQEVNAGLTQGWKVFRFWGNDIRKNQDFCVSQITIEVANKRNYEYL